MERKLATIQEIGAISAIFVGDEPASNIEQAFVNGWRVIVEKGKYKVGDPVVFLEEDSILPCDAQWVKEYAPFMEKHHWRVKLMKLNKMRTAVPYNQGFKWLPTISQGLIVPLSVLDTTSIMVWLFSSPSTGLDVTEALGITKHEDPVPTGAGETAGTFPKFIPKTDEVRVQSYPVLLDELWGCEAVATLKLDGSSVTVWFDDDDTPHVASRNHERRDGDNIYWNAVRQYLPNMVRFSVDYVFQGEVYGEGIQGNPMMLKGQHFAVHAVYSLRDKEYLSHHAEIDVCFAVGVPHVPVVAEWAKFDSSLEDLESIARGCYNNTINPREGIVVRPKKTRYSPTLDGRLSFKFINPDFLIKKG